MSAQVAELHHDGGHQHPGERTYVKVAVILALITIAEVAIYYIDSFSSFLVEALLIMSAFKFVTVVSYFMHLKFDDRRLAWTFGLAMIVALSVVLGLEVLFRFHRIDYAVNFLTD
jgi:cytochrome c oxidase subunit IV